jgi:hypothetical protein
VHVRLDSTRAEQSRAEQTSCFFTLLAASFFLKNNFHPLPNKKQKIAHHEISSIQRRPQINWQIQNKIKLFSTGLVRGIRRVVSRVRGSSSRGVRATTSCSQDASEPSVSSLVTDWTRDNTGQPSESPPVKPSPPPRWNFSSFYCITT